MGRVRAAAELAQTVGDDDRAHPGIDVRALARRSRPQLDLLFASLSAPALEQLDGDLRGTQVDVAGVDRLPPRLRAALLAVLRAPAGPWRGKRLAGTRGTNLWAVGPLRRTFAQFRVTLAEAVDGSGPCLQLDYDVPENALPLRGILGELRTLGPGLFLGRMHYRVGSGRTCLLYFTLES